MNKVVYKILGLYPKTLMANIVISIDKVEESIRHSQEKNC